MVNSKRAKGNRIRLKAIKELEAEGHKVAIVERTGRFIKIKDMFGLFDLVAIQKYNNPRFIQITTNKPHSHKDYKQFVEDYCENIEASPVVEQWVWYDKGKMKGWKKWQY